MNDKIKTAYNEMTTPSDVIDMDKFEQVCNLVDATPADVADFIDGGENGWENVDEHNDWLKNAPADEIAGWVTAGLN